MEAVMVYLAAAVILLTIAYFKYFMRFRLEGEPPHVPGHWLWGNAIHFSQHAVHFLQNSQKALGDIFTIRLLNKHVTMIIDPHCYDQFAKEKNFDFAPIQKNVNMNVFSFELKNSHKAISEASKTVNGKHLNSSLHNFTSNLNWAFSKFYEEQNKALDLNGNRPDDEPPMAQDGLRIFMAKTLFDALFYTIFGRAGEREEVETFNPDSFRASLDIYHKVFNYVWLGFPVKLFPKAHEALKVLCQQPSPADMMNRKGISEYIRLATEMMMKEGQSPMDVVGHNLVFLHVNYNIFKVSFWCLYHLLEKPHVRRAVEEELRQAVRNKRQQQNLEGEVEKVHFSMEVFDKLPLLDSFLRETIRTSSGVFLMRKVVEDTPFTMPSGQTYTVRKGDRVAMYPPVSHMDPEIFENPETFKFDRFVDAKFYKYGKQLRSPLLGFGVLCPGQKMSMLQVKWFLITVLHHFSMELVEGERTEVNTKCYGHEILPPVHDVQVRYFLKPDAPQLVFAPRHYA